jgi:hypothetical protein
MTFLDSKAEVIGLRVLRVGRPLLGVSSMLRWIYG